ncbi:MAG: zinc ribbon domain-containing protein [Promethearchaeota archaeon]|nr:MAG: zinc ribbon domain-containing protein [Candidatus Lokiarchaeota archaeon]
MKCPNCGQELDNSNQGVCQYCGAKIPQNIEPRNSSLDKNVYKTNKSKYSRYTRKKHLTFAVISMFLVIGSFIGLGFSSYLDFLISLSDGMENVIGAPFYIGPIIANIIGLILGIIAGFLRIKWGKENQTEDKFGTILIIITILLNVISIVVGGVIIIYQL